VCVRAGVCVIFEEKKIIGVIYKLIRNAQCDI
jgi:hypothetical protein